MLKSTRMGSVYEFGHFRLDTDEGLLLRKGQVVHLTPKAFETLRVLLENGGYVVRKDELMKEVWPDTFVEESNLVFTVSILRKALGEHASGHRYIETLPRRGYRFLAELNHLRESRDHGQRDMVEGHPPTAIAVLPFKALDTGAQSGTQALGVGMADALITKLRAINRITVRSTDVVRAQTVHEADPLAVGRRLKVDSVLGGSVQRSGDRVRVTVQLMSVRDGSVLWADSFDEKFTDVFSVQDSISKHVVGVLSLELTRDEATLLTKRYTEDTMAYELYLMGRYYWNKRTGEGFSKAMRYFEQAVERDPKYALANVGLADSYLLLATFGVLPSREVYPKAESAARRALEVDEAVPEAHTSLGYLKAARDRDWRAAEAEFRRAVELRPSYPTAHQWYAQFLEGMGRLEEARIEMNRAHATDPVSIVVNAHAATPLYYAREYAGAIDQLVRTVDMDPAFWLARYFLGWAYAQDGQLPEAVVEFQEARRLSGNCTWTLSALGYAHAVAGRKAEAERILRELIALSRRHYVLPYDLATVASALHKKSQALTCLEQADQDRSILVLWLKVDPRWDDLRAHPRFRELVERIGLP